MNFARKSQEKVRAESGAGIDNDSGVSSTMQPTESKIVLKLPQYNQIQFSLVISAVQFMYRIQLQFIGNSNNQYRSSALQSLLDVSSISAASFFCANRAKMLLYDSQLNQSFLWLQLHFREFFLSRNMEIPIQEFFRESSELCW